MLTKQENNMPFKTKKKKVSAVGRHVINYSENAVISYSSGKQSFIHAKGNSNDLNSSGTLSISSKNSLPQKRRSDESGFSPAATWFLWRATRTEYGAVKYQIWSY